MVCPERSTCNVDLGLCVSDAQTAACRGKVDGESCDLTAADESCFMGICLPYVCGDGRMDGPEACDDGNREAGDGCSTRCDSKETCGNGVVDTTVGEDCDDGNLLDHDGCSSSCGAELPRLSRRPTAPGRRFSMALAYDNDRDRLLMVGGNVDTAVNGSVSPVGASDAWEWDGRWREARTAPPPPRFVAGMAYDEARKRMVYITGGPYQHETWEYDGTTWTLVTTVGPRRTNAAVAYDPIRKRIVMHGGLDEAGTSVGGQRVWNGTTWDPIALPNTGTLPAARSAGRMAFDYKRGKLVLFGGYTGSAYLNDLWEYDGTSWANRTLDGSSGSDIPTRRSAMAMAWNEACECIIVFGGINGLNTVDSETYSWNGTAWNRLTGLTGATPGQRASAGFASDGHGRTILVGGFSFDAGGKRIEDTWIFDGVTWRQEVSHVAPMTALDVDRHRLVMHSGSIHNGPDIPSGDTYELSSRGWSLVTSAGPAVLGGSMEYDEARHEMVLFGGAHEDFSLETATWIYNGTWSTRTVTTQATPQTRGMLVYDDARKNLVAFGGVASGTSSNETWTWNGITWTKQTPATSPSPRSRVAAGYDRVHQQVVLFGGLTQAGDNRETWLWDGVTWTLVSTAPMETPSGVYPRMAWDAARRKLVLVSGPYMEGWEWTGSAWSSLGPLRPLESPDDGFLTTSFDGAGVTLAGGYYYFSQESSDAWDLRWDSAHTSDTCGPAADLDGDTLAGCLDRDCWSVCTPSCRPGETCDPAAPSCGDGTCSPAEDCGSCPADCTSCGNYCGDGVCGPGETCLGDC